MNGSTAHVYIPEAWRAMPCLMAQHLTGGRYQRFRHITYLLHEHERDWTEIRLPAIVVGQVWGKVGANKYLLDQIRARLDFPSTIRAVRTFFGRYPTSYTKLIEDKANGPAVIATLKNEISGLIAVEPNGGKEARANAVSPEVEAGNVYLPDPALAPWIHDFIEEFANFPNAVHVIRWMRQLRL